ncbi:lipid-binding SYLF domain-containing protein [Flagellimonas sp. 2504JD1-5]
MGTSQLRMSKLMSMIMALMLSVTVSAQKGGWNPQLENDAKKALDTILVKMPKLESYKDEAHGYAVFPSITKAAATVGVDLGNGIVYKDHQAIGMARLKQLNVGYQLGGQQYIEIIFFENEEVFEKFKNGKLKLDAQASVVALKGGASFDVAYQDGVAVFTMTKGGLMYEASIGGQRFKYVAK